MGSLKEFAHKTAQLPLGEDPGEKFQYSMSIDVLGYVVEVASGMPFERFVQTRICDPLKMHDTSFIVPAENARAWRRHIRPRTANW